MNLYDLKEMIYGLLLDVTQPESESESINAVQQSKINVTAAMAKSGVNVINNQTQTFMVARLVPKIIDIIKMIDAIEVRELPQPIINQSPFNQIEYIKDSTEKDIIKKFCKYLFSRKMEIKEAQEFVKKKYVQYVYLEKGNVKIAAEQINCSERMFHKHLDIANNYHLKLEMKKKHSNLEAE